MEPDLKRLAHFNIVAECENMTVAAEQLGLTQSALSRSISSLEAIWGVRLFERSQKGVRPTRIGLELLEEARSLLDQVRTLDHNMTLRSTGNLGKAAFGIAPLIGGILTGDILSRSVNETPGLSLTVTIKPLPELLGDLKIDASDFAIFSESRLPETEIFTFEPLGRFELRFVVRDGHPILKTEQSWDTLAKYPMATSPYFRDMHLPGLSYIQCDSYHAMRDAMLCSDLVCLTSPWLLVDSLKAGEAHILDFRPDASLTTSSLYVASVKGRLHSPASLRVLEHAKTLINEYQMVEIA